MRSTSLKKEVVKSFFSFLILVIFPGMCLGQLIFHQSAFHGGVTAGGFSTGLGSGYGIVNLYIEPGSSIRRAYILAFTSGLNTSSKIGINGLVYHFGESTKLTSVGITNPFFSPIETHAVDFTDDLQVNPTTGFAIELFDLPDLPFLGVFAPYIYVEYENVNLPSVNSIIVINQQPLTGDEVYTINNMNFISTDFPLSFALYTDRTGSGFIPNEDVYFNSNFLGVVGGSDSVNNNWNFGGVKGHFYYQNNELFGLDDDTPDAFMSGTDGLANVSDYLNNNASTCNFQLRNINYPNQPFNATSVKIAYLLTYTPNCPVLEPLMERKYSYCHGSSVQMQAAPGFTNYQWEPSTGLSNTSIPNPVCSATQSGWYRVRMWSTGPDAPCEQTIPVFVTVHDPPRAFGTSTGFSLCHNPTGSIAADSLGGAGPYSFALNSESIEGLPVQNLGAGNYLLSITDAKTCVWDSTFNVPSIIVTNVAFTANPTDGESPLDVQFQDQSTQANAWQWEANGLPFSSQQNPFYTFADTGTYTVSLIAYLNNPACADTATITIRVNPGIRIALPNIFTPNGDGTNDRLVAELFGVSSMRWEVYNRWGNLLYSGDDSSGAASVEIWDGTANGNLVPAGVYPVQVTAQGLNGKVESMQVMVTVVY
jgi:gliding motility-associated-like protein